MPVIALDLGGTKLTAAIFNNEGDILHKTTTLLEKRKGEEVGNLIREVTNSHLLIANEISVPISAIGICVPGIAYRNGNVWAPNIGGWDDYPLRTELETAFQGIRLHIDSDRACCISGEVWKGSAKGCSDAIYLTVGTGIGAGILVNHEILRGANDIAGAIGWMALNKPFEEKYISCGCFEYHASGEGLAKVAGEKIRMKQSILQTSDPSSLNAVKIIEAYSNGDEIATAVIQNAIEYWGMAIANLVSLFNPQKVIFGGGVFGPALQFLDDIYAEAKKWAQPISIMQVELTGSALGNEAGIYGAARLALIENTNPLHV